MKARFLLLFLLLFSINGFSQEPDSVEKDNNHNIIDIKRVLNEDNDMIQQDEESIEIDVKNNHAEKLVDYSQELFDYANLLIENDSLVYYFTKSINSENLFPIEDETDPFNIERKFRVVFHPNTLKPVLIGEMVLNEIQAWDFIYNSYFDLDGHLRLFVREYNTFYSECAEVAFERSMYFYNQAFELIKKTYEVFDQNYTPLDIDDCYMDREDYTKYKTLDQFLSAFNFSLDNIMESLKKIP